MKFLDHLLKENHAPEHVGLQDELPDTVKQVVNAVAEDILENINKAVVINPISLISLVLLNAPTHALAERDVLQRLEQFRGYLKQHCYDTRMKITELSNHEIIQYAIQLKQIEFVEHDNERWIKVCEKQDALLKYFSNNILHTFILPALIANTLKVQLANDNFDLAIDALKESALLVYPEIKKQFFLKWTEEQLLLEIDQVLAYFVAERVIQIQAQTIHMNDADDSLRFLSSFAHLYELNLTKE